MDQKPVDIDNNNFKVMTLMYLLEVSLCHTSFDFGSNAALVIFMCLRGVNIFTNLNKTT